MQQLEVHSLIVPPQLAARLGLNEAIILNQLHYWLEQAPKHNLGRLINGTRWIYNRLVDWLGNFPFMTRYALRKAIANLRNQGLIETEQLEKRETWRRRYWYRICYDKLDAILKPAETTQTQRASQNEPSKGADPDPPRSDDAIVESSTVASSESKTTPKTTAKTSFSGQGFGKQIKKKKKEPSEYEQWYKLAHRAGLVCAQEGPMVILKDGLYGGSYRHWQEVAKQFPMEQLRQDVQL